MFKLFKRKENASEAKESSPTALTWDAKATQALEQAVAGAPVPGMLKNRVKNELKKAAEAVAQKAGHTTVSPEDLMEGMLSKMPAAMRAKVEAAAQQGPEALAKLKDELGNKSK